MEHNIYILWREPWIPLIPCYIPSPKNNEILVDNHLIVDPHFKCLTTGWNFFLLSEIFVQSAIHEITQIKIYPTVKTNQMIWSHGKKEFFLSNQLNYLQIANLAALASPNLSSKEWRKFWKLQIHKRLKLFLWKLVWDVLPATNRIQTSLHSCLLFGWWCQMFNLQINKRGCWPSFSRMWSSKNHMEIKPLASFDGESSIQAAIRLDPQHLRPLQH